MRMEITGISRQKGRIASAGKKKITEFAREPLVGPAFPNWSKLYLKSPPTSPFERNKGC